MVQVAAVINSQKLEPFPPSFTPSLPPLTRAAGDELLANDYVAGTPHSISLLPREEGGREVEEEEGAIEGGEGEGEEAAPARTARRGEKNLRLMMSGGGGGGGGGGSGRGGRRDRRRRGSVRERRREGGKDGGMKRTNRNVCKVGAKRLMLQ